MDGGMLAHAWRDTQSFDDLAERLARSCAARSPTARYSPSPRKHPVRRAEQGRAEGPVEERQVDDRHPQQRSQPDRARQ